MTTPTLAASMLSTMSALLLPAMATASVTMYTDAATYGTAVAGMSRSTETFASYSDGTYATPLTGAAGPVAWTATASQGLLVTSSRLAAVGGQAMLISFSAGALPIRGVSGDFFATNGGSIASAVIQVEMNDGTSLLEAVSDPGSFIAFYSSSAAITSIRISIYSSGSAANPTVDNLGFAYVPSPGSIVLLAVSRLFAPRRRR